MSVLFILLSVMVSVFITLNAKYTRYYLSLSRLYRKRKGGVWSYIYIRNFPEVRYWRQQTTHYNEVVIKTEDYRN